MRRIGAVRKRIGVKGSKMVIIETGYGGIVVLNTASIIREVKVMV